MEQNNSYVLYVRSTKYSKCEFFTSRNYLKLEDVQNLCWPNKASRHPHYHSIMMKVCLRSWKIISLCFGSS